jgi:hypothetical protein
MLKDCTALGISYKVVYLHSGNHGTKGAWRAVQVPANKVSQLLSDERGNGARWAHGHIDARRVESQPRIRAVEYQAKDLDTGIYWVIPTRLITL